MQELVINSTDPSLLSPLPLPPFPIKPHDFRFLPPYIQIPVWKCVMNLSFQSLDAPLRTWHLCGKEDHFGSGSIPELLMDWLCLKAELDRVRYLVHSLLSPFYLWTDWWCLFTRFWQPGDRPTTRILREPNRGQNPVAKVGKKGNNGNLWWTQDYAQNAP